MAPPVEIAISYNPRTLRGSFQLQNHNDSAIWERLTQRALALETNYELSGPVLDLPWATVLSLIREFAPLQRQEQFCFRPSGEAKERIDQFVREYKTVRASRNTLKIELTEAQILERLRAGGFTKRELKPFQMRDLLHLLTLSNGANFSVP